VPLMRAIISQLIFSCPEEQAPGPAFSIGCAHTQKSPTKYISVIDPLTARRLTMRQIGFDQRRSLPRRRPLWIGSEEFSG
jgi:hypothetical protein